MNIHRYYLLLPLFFMQYACAQLQPGQQLAACSDIPRPTDGRLSGEPSHHLPSAAIYPKIFPKNYTGCGYFWFKEDEFLLYSVARFEKGIVAEGLINDLLEPVKVYCRPGVQQEHELTCKTFTELWTDAAKFLGEDAPLPTP